jgi:hypothetical protein
VHTVAACRVVSSDVAEMTRCGIVRRAVQELVVVSSQDLSGGERMPAHKGIAGYVVSTGQNVNIAGKSWLSSALCVRASEWRPLGVCVCGTDAYTDSRFDPSHDFRTGFKTTSVIAVPIRDEGGSVIGVLQVCAATRPLRCRSPSRVAVLRLCMRWSTGHQQAECDRLHGGRGDGGPALPVHGSRRVSAGASRQPRCRGAE